MSDFVTIFKCFIQLFLPLSVPLSDHGISNCLITTAFFKRSCILQKKKKNPILSCLSRFVVKSDGFCRSKVRSFAISKRKAVAFDDSSLTKGLAFNRNRFSYNLLLKTACIYYIIHSWFYIRIYNRSVSVTYEAKDTMNSKFEQCYSTALHRTWWCDFPILQTILLINWFIC